MTLTRSRIADRKSMDPFRPQNVLTILNPSAGRSDTDGIGTRIADLLSANGIRGEQRQTAKQGDAQEWATHAATDGFDLVVAVGGDGTLAEVVSGILRAPKKAPVAMIPAGTANIAAQCLGIPDAIDEAVNCLVNGRLERLDIGYVPDRDRHFVIAAAIGFPARIVSDAPRSIKKQLGFLAYLVAAVRNLRRLVRPVRVEIETEGAPRVYRSHTILVSNMGADSGPRLESRVDASDGKLQVAVVTSRTVGGTIRLATRLLLHKQRDPKIARLEAARVRVTAHPPQPVHIDGEMLGTTPIEIETLPAAIDFVVPLESESSQ